MLFLNWGLNVLSTALFCYSESYIPCPRAADAKVSDGHPRRSRLADGVEREPLGNNPTAQIVSTLFWIGSS